MVRILIFGMYENAMYHPLTDVERALREILPEMELHFTDQILDLCKAEAYDAIISYWDDWNAPIPDRAADALLRYVEQGGALLVLHNGISIQLQDCLKKAVGGRFITHPAQEAITFMVKENEITEGCHDFTLVEEPYQFELEEDEKEIFLTYLYRGKEYPAGWRKWVGKGKTVYLTPGHTAEQFQCAEYRQLIRKCMDWLLESKLVTCKGQRRNEEKMNNGKLVRDKIPQIIREAGKNPVIRILSDEEYLVELDKKLSEEVAEYQADKSIEEMADVLEVLFAICEARGYSVEELLAVKEAKREARGGFADKIFWSGNGFIR